MATVPPAGTLPPAAATTVTMPGVTTATDAVNNLSSAANSAAANAQTTVSIPLDTLGRKTGETTGVPATSASAAPVTAATTTAANPSDTITTLPALDEANKAANGTANGGLGKDGAEADPYADLFAQATEAQERQDVLDDEKVVVLRGMAASTYIAIRRLWHGYLFFAVYLIIVVSAMSIQLSLFFSLLDPTGTAVNFSAIAARLSASLLVAIVFSIFSSQCWEILRSFWRGEDSLPFRKIGYVWGWKNGISKFFDWLAQIVIILCLDIGPLIIGWGFFKGDAGQFVEYFFTAALCGAALIVIIKIAMEIINGAYQLIMLCVRKKWQPIPTLRQLTRLKGFQQARSNDMFTTRKSTKNWFCFWFIDQSQDSAGGLMLQAVLVIVVTVFVVLGTVVPSWWLIAELTYLIFLFISWGWMRIWDPVIDYAKREAEFIELTPMERALIDKDVGSFDVKFNTKPIVYPWSTPTLRWSTLFVLFGQIALAIWLAVLIGIKGYALLVFLNLYIAIPYIVVFVLYVYSMHPANWKSDSKKSWLEKMKVWQLQVDATKSFKNVDGAQEPPVLKPFLATYNTTITVVLLAIPLIAAVAFLIYFLATASASANTALVGLFAAFYLVFAIAIVFFLSKAVVGFPMEAFLASYIILMIVILAIFTTGVTYTGDVGGASANAGPNGPPIPASAQPFPICNYTLYGQTVVTMGFAAAISYDLPELAGNDVLLWLGPQWKIVYQWIEPTLQFYEFRNQAQNLSIISVRGTADATSALIDMDLWSQVAMFQFADWFVPLLRAWPWDIARGIIRVTSLSTWQSQPPLYQPLVEHVQLVQTQGVNIIITGHSLGGGMASIAGALTGLKSVGYSPPGIKWSSLKFGIQDMYSLDETMISIYAKGDVVPAVDTHGGMVQQIPCESGSTLACHYITRTLTFLQQSCGDPQGRTMIQNWLTPEQYNFILQQTDFGDSYSDVGNTYRDSDYYWPWWPYYEGRTSNGPVWAEKLVEGSSSIIDWKNGMNRAMASSGVDKELLDCEPKFPETGVAQQIKAFLGTGLAEDLKKAKDTTPMFFIWVGINDVLRSLVVRNDPTSFNGVKVPEVSTLVAREVELVSQLFATYPRAKFVLLNVIPIDQSPITLKGSGAPDSAWSYQNALGRFQIRQMVQDWNTALATSLFPGQSAGRDRSNASHALLDTNGRFSDAIATLSLPPEQQRLDNVTWPCLDSSTKVQNCADAGKYFWWDYVHPTARIHSWVGGGWVKGFLEKWLGAPVVATTTATTAAATTTMAARETATSSTLAPVATAVRTTSNSSPSSGAIKTDSLILRTSSPNKPPVLSQGISVSQPDGNKTSTTKEAAGALATVSTAVDPMPHFVLAGASLGSGAYYLYRKPPMTTLGWGLAAAGLAYGYAGYLLGSTDRQQQRLGYDISTVASIGLVAVTGPTVYNKGLFADILQSGLATVGAVSTVGNANKAYQMRTGQPKELQVKRT